MNYKPSQEEEADFAEFLRTRKAREDVWGVNFNLTSEQMAAMKRSINARNLRENSKTCCEVEAVRQIDAVLFSVQIAQLKEELYSLIAKFDEKTKAFQGKSFPVEAVQQVEYFSQYFGGIGDEVHCCKDAVNHIKAILLSLEI